jgi:protein O-mannosyl-transferase
MSSSRDNRVVISCLALIAATLAFYNPIIHNQFTGFDDWNYILKNPQIQNGLTWNMVKWAFTTFWEGNWHPLTWLSHALDYQLFGLNPVGHHYTNLLFHAANAVLLFLLLRRATGAAGPSLLVAALFALHPVNVESVAWAAERKNVLSMFFFLLALHAYDRYVGTSRRRLYSYLGVVILFALGLMAKPQIVTLPFVLLLWDYWPLQRLNARSGVHDSSQASSPTARSFGFLVWEKLPLFALAAADSVVTAIAQRAGNAVRTLSEAPLQIRMENIFVSYVRYIGEAFWPTRLAPMYPRPDSLPLWQVAGSVALLVVVSVLVWFCRERRYLLVGWCWFLGTLVPMIGLVTVGDQARADRYAYLPFIGLFVAVVWTVDAAASEYRIAQRWRATAAVCLVFILGSLTYRQLGYWRDDATLWHYTLSVTDRNYVAHNNLALMLKGEGRSEEAVAEFRTAKALHKYPPNQVLTLGFYELRVGHPTEAIEECNSVVHDSTDPKLQARAWGGIGQAQLQLQKYDQAAESYQTALRLNPDEGVALMGSGLLAMRDEQFDLAVTQLMHAAKVEPNDLNVLLFAQALRRAGNEKGADTMEAQVQKISSDPKQAKLEAEQWLGFAGLKLL